MALSSFQRLIDLAERLQESGAVDDAELIRLAISGLTDMSVGASRLLTIARAITKVAETKQYPPLLTLAEGAKLWGERLRDMAHTGVYEYNHDETHKLPSNYVQPDEIADKEVQDCLDELGERSPIVGLSWDDVGRIAEVLTRIPLLSGNHLNNHEVGVILAQLLKAGYTMIKVGPT